MVAAEYQNYRFRSRTVQHHFTLKYDFCLSGVYVFKVDGNRFVKDTVPGLDHSLLCTSYSSGSEEAERLHFVL